MTTATFRVNGKVLDETSTPCSFQLGDGATIEVYRQQTGG